MKNLLILGICLLLSHSTAQGKEPGLEMDDIVNMSLQELLQLDVTTTSKFHEDISDSPASLHVFTAEQIDHRGYRNLADLLKAVPGVHYSLFTISDTYNSINLRGVAGNTKFLILQDGVRISSAAGESFPVGYNYPLYYAKQVEVLLGPSSVVYGADAFMGVVNIITQDEKSRDVNEVSLYYGSDNYGYGYFRRNK